MKTLHTLHLNSTEPTVISVCKIHGGTKEIIVPDTVELEGSIRCLHNQDAKVREKFKNLCTAVCAAYGCRCEITFKCGNTLLSNDEAMAELLTHAAARVVGRENIQTRQVSVMLGDDFAEFSNRIPGVYYFIGTGSEKAASTYEHHNPHFNIDEQSLAIGVQVQLELVKEYLGF